MENIVLEVKLDENTWLVVRQPKKPLKRATRLTLANGSGCRWRRRSSLSTDAKLKIKLRNRHTLEEPTKNGKPGVITT